MNAAVGRRLRAIILLAIFVGGGFGLPGLDVMLFHSGRHVPATLASHFDQPGGCGDHAEHCTLATLASTVQIAGLGPKPARTEAITRALTGTIPTTFVPSATRGFLQPSRAPPVQAS